MKFDLTGLVKKTSEEVKKAESRSAGSNRTPILYPAEDGTLRVKLLYNPKADATQKRVCRHTVGKEKLVCLEQSYGEECPICNAVRTVADTKGRESGVFRKYGVKKRGIAYAILVSHEAGMLKESNSPKDKDLVMLMYPDTVYQAINKELSKSADKLSEILVDNESYTFEIIRSLGANNIPSYEAKVYPYGKEKIFGTDEEMDKLIEGLPNLNEQITPESYDKISEEALLKIKAAADTIKKEYFSGNVLNPNDFNNATSSGNNGSNFASPMYNGTPAEPNSYSGEAMFEEIIENGEVPF